MARSGRIARALPPLVRTVDKLVRLYGKREPSSNPVELLVWENIGYLIDDDKRAALLQEFGKRVGFRAAQIANAPTEVLADIAKRGGLHPQERAERLRAIGALIIAECDGNLDERLRALPLAKARTLLKKFPVIGDPGADKVLLFAGIAAQAALDSNGLRVLVRLGYCAEEKSYAATYKGGVAALKNHGESEAKWLRRAYIVLREHGKALCKRSTPLCEPCPLDGVCKHQLTARL